MVDRYVTIDDVENVQQLVLRWIAALNNQGKGGSVPIACDKRIEIHRYVPGSDAAAAIFSGHDMVEVWVRRTPATNQFELVDKSVKQIDDFWWEARYRVRADNWANQGTWRFRVGPEGTLVELHHRPDALLE